MIVDNGVLLEVEEGDIKNGGFEFPYGVTSVGAYAFCGLNSLKSIKIEKGVKSIGEFAFDHCHNLKTVFLPDGVKSIGKRAFSNCRIENIVIPNSVKSIGDDAFLMSKIDTITLPEHLAQDRTWREKYAINKSVNVKVIDYLREKYFEYQRVTNEKIYELNQRIEELEKALGLRKDTEGPKQK